MKNYTFHFCICIQGIGSEFLKQMGRVRFSLLVHTKKICLSFWLVILRQKPLAWSNVQTEPGEQKKDKTQHIAYYSNQDTSLHSLLIYTHTWVPFLMNVSFYFLFLYSFGLAPAGPLQVLTPLSPNQSVEVTLPLSTVGPVMKMDPLTNLQVLTNWQLLDLSQWCGMEFFVLSLSSQPLHYYSYYYYSASNSSVVSNTKIMNNEAAFRAAVINVP